MHTIMSTCKYNNNNVKRCYSLVLSVQLDFSVKTYLTNALTIARCSSHAHIEKQTIATGCLALSL